VTRAIAQAFMDADMERIVDGDESSPDQMRWKDDENKGGFFGDRPHGSEYKTMGRNHYRGDPTHYDEQQRPWNIKEYMEQLKNPRSTSSDHRTRKSLNEILREITDRRTKEHKESQKDE